MATTLTGEALTRILVATRDELGELTEQYPVLRLPLHGAQTVLASGLAAARRQSEIVARGTLLGSAKMAGEAISGALRRHPEYAVPDSRIRDVRDALALAEVGS